MKKVFLVLMFSLILSMTACGGKDAKQNPSSSEVSSASGEITAGGGVATESYEEVADSEFNFDDEHIKSVEAYLKDFTVGSYDCSIEENGRKMVDSYEKFDTVRHIIETYSDYSGYKEILLSDGVSEEELEGSAVKVHTFIDCDNRLYLMDNDEKNDYVHYKSAEEFIDFNMGLSSSTAFDMWVVNMSYAGITFNGGTWAEEDGKVIYKVSISDEDSGIIAEDTKVTFSKVAAGLKPESVVVYGKYLNNDGSEIETSSTIDYKFGDIEIVLPEYRVVDDTIEESTKAESVESNDVTVNMDTDGGTPSSENEIGMVEGIGEE